jgi:hypothetical protein
LGEMKADQAVRGIWACFCDQRLTRAPKPPGIPRDQGSGIWRATGAYARGSTFQATERARLRVPAAARARGLHRSPLERMKRAQGRPGDRCTRGPRAKKIAQTGTGGDIPAFPARWFYGLCVLSSVNHPVCHRRPSRSFQLRWDLAPRPWGARTTRLRRTRSVPLVDQHTRVPRIPPRVS